MKPGQSLTPCITDLFVSGEAQLKNSKTKMPVANEFQLDLWNRYVCPGQPSLVTAPEAFTDTKSLYQWEVVPKFFFTKWLIKDISTSDNAAFTQKFVATVRDSSGAPQKVDCNVVITPALVNGEFCYPGETEELVEEALKFLSTRGRIELVHDDEPSNRVSFTYRDIKRVLIQHGRDRTIPAIAKAIEVMDKTHLEINIGSGVTVTTSLLQDVKTITRARYERIKNDPDSATKPYRRIMEEDSDRRINQVSLPNLMSAEIANLRHRQINAEILMALKSGLARDIYRRLANNFTQAGPGGSPYNLRRSHMLNTGRLWSKTNKVYQHQRKIKQALDELVEAGVICSGWTIENVYGHGNRKTVTDVIYHFQPGKRFISDTKRANKHTQLLEFEKLKECTDLDRVAKH